MPRWKWLLSYVLVLTLMSWAYLMPPVTVRASTAGPGVLTGNPTRLVLPQPVALRAHSFEADFRSGNLGGCLGQLAGRHRLPRDSSGHLPHSPAA